MIIKPRLHDTAGCQTGCTTGLTTGLTTVLNEQLFVQPVVKPGCTTGLTTGLTTGCIVYTNIYPVAKPVWQPVWQQVVSCKRGLTVTLVVQVQQSAVKINEFNVGPVTKFRTQNCQSISRKRGLSQQRQLIGNKGAASPIYYLGMPSGKLLPKYLTFVLFYMVKIDINGRFLGLIETFACSFRTAYRESLSGRRAFIVACPTAWNSLPDYLRDPSLSEDTFRRLLKTYLFALY